MRPKQALYPLPLLCLLCLPLPAGGCAPTLETPNDSTDAGGDTPCATADPICNADIGDNVTLTHIAALDQREWVYFDFQTMAAPAPATPEDSTEWDLAFRRFVVKTNGGVSGTGGVQFAVVEGLNFSSLTLPPTNTDWLADAPDDDDPDLDPEYLMATGESGWFDYNPATHVLTPRERIYAVRSVEGAHYKLEFETYYDDAGSPAHIRFKWAPLAERP